MIKIYRRFGAAFRGNPRIFGSRFIALYAALGFGLSFISGAPPAFAECDEPSSIDETAAPYDETSETGCESLPPMLDLSMPAANAAAVAKGTYKTPEVAKPSEAAAAPVPVAVQSSDDSVSARASLQTLRDYNAQLLKDKVDHAPALAKAAGVLSKSTASKPALDVWSSFKADGLNDAETSVRTGAGFDYKVIKNTSVGVSAHRTETATAHVPGAESEDTVGAYMAFKALPSVTIDASTQWATATAADPTLGSRTEDTGTLLLAPRIEKSFSLGEGQTIAPHVTLKHEVDFTGTTGESSGHAVTRSAGAGVTFTEKDSYSLSVTTDVTESAASEPASVNSKLQFKLPLP